MAQQHIARARELGVGAELVRKMESVTRIAIPWWRRWGLAPPLVVAAVLLAGAALLLLHLPSRKASAGRLAGASS